MGFLIYHSFYYVRGVAQIDEIMTFINQHNFFQTYGILNLLKRTIIIIAILNSSIFASRCSALCFACKIRVYSDQRSESIASLNSMCYIRDS